MSEISPKVPERCPLLKTCPRKIDEKDFERECIRSSWIYCYAAVKEAKKYLPKVTPCEWYVTKKIGEQEKDQ